MVRFGIWTAAALIGASMVSAGMVSAEEQEWHIPEDETLVCNVGSACLEDLREANGSRADMWPEIGHANRISRIESEKNRLKLNKYQPAVAPKYTEVGYKKEKLPDDTYAYIMEWYNDVAESKTKEEWQADNTYFNHWKVASLMTHAPIRVIERLYKDLLPLMEGWAGISLEPTACYGVRIYERGSVLANHVDRVDTHVISAIINVAQHDVDKDWPLFVRGHDGVDNNIFIQPGEIIFYESASVLHGRPTPFEGGSFANIFVHFTPTQGWDVTAKEVSAAAHEDSRQKSRERGSASQQDAQEEL